MINRIKASELKPGMIMAFSNPRFNYLIDDIRWMRDGDIAIDHGNFTAVDFYQPDDIVWISTEA